MTRGPEFPIPASNEGSVEHRIPAGLYQDDDFRRPPTEVEGRQSSVAGTKESGRADAAPARETGETVTEALRALSHVRENELGVHALTGKERPEGATELLVGFGEAEDNREEDGDSRIYTHAETPDPGKYRHDYLPRRRTERQLDTLKDNAKMALENVDEFEEAAQAKRLGSMLLRTFGAVQEVAFKDVHVADPTVRTMRSVKVRNQETGKREGKKVMVDGFSTVGKTEFTVDTDEEARLLHGALSALSRTDRIHDAHHVSPPVKSEDGRWVVGLSNLDEYDNRMMETAVARIVAEEDAANGLIGTTLPERKMTLSSAQKRGVTYHPEMQDRIAAAQQQYDTLRATMKTPTYREGMPSHEDTREAMDRKPEVLTMSPSAVFEAIRKHMNANVKHIRGDGSRNQEQHPDKEQRLLIEKGVRLKRATGRPGQDEPPEMQALRLRESMYESGRTVVKTERQHPIKAAIKLLAKGIGAGLVDSALDVAAEIGSRGREGVSHRRKDRKAWRDEKNKAMSSVQKTGKRIDRILDHYSSQEK
jgi:hypothetical protein